MVHIHYGILFSYIKQGILPFAAIWMVLVNVMINKIGQTVKDKYYILLTESLESKKSNLQKPESKMVVTRGLRGENL